MTWSSDPGIRIPQRVQRAVHRRDHGACQLGYPGCLGDGTQVDHIIGIAELGIHRRDSYNDLSNLQLVCEPCHRKKTAQQGVAGQRRRRAAARRQPERHPGLLW
ncbi:HNH endonuclease signature motif containing protein [Mycolicibacterium elephantis]